MLKVLPLTIISTEVMGALELAVYHKAKLLDTELLFAGLTIVSLTPIHLSHPPHVPLSHVVLIAPDHNNHSLSVQICSGSDAKNVYDCTDPVSRAHLLLHT